MGIIIAFPDKAASLLRPGAKVASGDTGQVLILPVIRIERQTDETNGSEPQDSTAPKRRRKRRARS